jgi:hypothetical protein
MSSCVCLAGLQCFKYEMYTELRAHNVNLPAPEPRSLSLLTPHSQLHSLLSFSIALPHESKIGPSDQAWYPALDPRNPSMFTVSKSISTGPFRPWETENELIDRQLNLRCSLCFSHVNSAVKPCQMLREFDIHFTGQTWKVLVVPSFYNKRNRRVTCYGYSIN